MTIDLPFEINKRIFFTSSDHIFNSGVIEAVETEVFVKVRDDATGEVRTLKPDAIKTRAETETYINGVLSKLQTLPDEGPLPEAPAAGE